MTYQGVSALVRIGRGGLMTDLNDSDIPDTHLVIAKNVEMKNGLTQKEPGSRRWNGSVLSSGVKALIDWFPAEAVQRFYAVTSDGKVWKLPDPSTQTEITASGSAPTTLTTSEHTAISFVAGGEESPGNSRKLFIFSKTNQIQVIAADAIVRTNISEPTVDWTGGTFPRGGSVHRNRLWAFMGHRIWASSATDQEKFITGAIQFAIYPGEGEEIVASYVYRKRLFLFKRPKGVYMLIDDDTNTANWYFTKVSDEFGAAGPEAIATVKDDMLVANAYGSVTSARAVEQAAGDINSGDIFGLLKVSNYFKDSMNLENLDLRKMIYYPDRQVCYMAYQASSGYRNDRLLKIDMAMQRPELTVVEKDQVECFALRQHVNGRKVPYYGSQDGYIYEMDRADRDVANSAYTMQFRTANMDFSWMDPSFGALNKNFDAIQFKVIPTGRWDVTLRYYIDGIFIESKTFQPTKGAVLGDFVLAQDRLGSPSSAIITKKLNGRGRTIAIELELGGVRQNMKMLEMRVHFRPSNIDDKETDAGRS